MMVAGGHLIVAWNNPTEKEIEAFRSGGYFHKYHCHRDRPNTPTITPNTFQPPQTLSHKTQPTSSAPSP